MVTKYICFMSMLLVSAIYCAADTEKYQQNSPYFYAALSDVAYSREYDYKDVQKELNKLLGKGNATLIKTDVYTRGFGDTQLILVKDKYKNFHIAIEGSSDVGNWIGNLIAYPITGAFKDNDVPTSILKDMHRIIKRWKQQWGPIITISGHSQGGMFVSQLAHYRKDQYKDMQIITFNAFKPKKHGNQLHFAVGHEHAATLCSPSSRYIPVVKGGAHWKIISNHQLKYFLQGLKDKTWQDVL